MADKQKFICPVAGCSSKVLKDIPAHLYRQHKDLSLEERKSLTKKAVPVCEKNVCVQNEAGIGKTEHKSEFSLEDWEELLQNSLLSSDNDDSDNSTEGMEENGKDEVEEKRTSYSPSSGSKRKVQDTRDVSLHESDNIPVEDRMSPLPKRQCKLIPQTKDHAGNKDWLWLKESYASLLKNTEWSKETFDEMMKLCETHHGILRCPGIDSLVYTINKYIMGSPIVLPHAAEMKQLGILTSAAIRKVIDSLENGQQTSRSHYLERILMLLCKTLRKIRHIMRLQCLHELKIHMKWTTIYPQDSEYIFGASLATEILQERCGGLGANCLKSLSIWRKRHLFQACKKVLLPSEVKSRNDRLWEAKARSWVTNGVPKGEWESVCQKSDMAVKRANVLHGIFNQSACGKLDHNIRNLIHLIEHTCDCTANLQ